MAKENLFLKNAKEKNLIDEREIVVVADIYCTNGNSGRAWVFLNGSTMQLFEMAGFSDLGPHVETIALKSAKLLKSSSFIMGSSMKLLYKEHTYVFKGFAQAKKFIEAVKESCSE